MASVPHEAVVTDAEGSLSKIYDHVIPHCSREAVLVKVHSVALNPSDYKFAALVKQDGLVSGCDFSGEVVQVGDRANALLRGSREPWKVGDRICGAVLGANPGKPTCGAFARFVEADPLVLIRIPEDWDWNTGAAVGGSCIGAVGMALFQELSLSLDHLRGAVQQFQKTSSVAKTKPSTLETQDLKKLVLVNGGSTASGTIAIQILQLAGYIPIATCSPHNEKLVTSCGAVAVFDYNSQTCAQDIKTYTKSSLALVIDCVATFKAATLCYAAIGRGGGRYVSLEKFPDSVAYTRRAIRASWVMGPLMLGGNISAGNSNTYSLESSAETRNFAREWFAVAQSMLRRRILQPHPVRLLHHASWMDAVIIGLSNLQGGNVSGQKLVIPIQ